MAGDKPISQLPENTTPNDNDFYYTSTPGTPRGDKFIRLSKLKELFGYSKIHDQNTDLGTNSADYTLGFGEDGTVTLYFGEEGHAIRVNKESTPQILEWTNNGTDWYSFGTGGGGADPNAVQKSEFVNKPFASTISILLEEDNENEKWETTLTGGFTYDHGTVVSGKNAIHNINTGAVSTAITITWDPAYTYVDSEGNVLDPTYDLPAGAGKNYQVFFLVLPGDIILVKVGGVPSETTGGGDVSAASETVAGIAEILTAAEVEAESDDTRILTIKKWTEKPIPERSYSATLTFTKRENFSKIQQSANIIISVDLTGAIDGAWWVLKTNGDNIHSMTFNANIEKEANSPDFDNTKYNAVVFTYDEFADKVYYLVRHQARLVTDLTPPQIISANLQGANKYVDITFNEGVYTNTGGSGGVTSSDFSLSFFQNSGTATACVISAVKRNDSAVSGSASALTGGETTVRIFLGITGNTNGQEYISINIATNSSIYDGAGNAMLSTQGTGNLTLNAADITSPIITGYQLAGNNSYVDVLFSEGIYTDIALNPPVSADFNLTFAQNGGAATAGSIASITTTAGGALGGGESTIRFNLSLTGTPTGVETIVITPVSGAALYDAAGNVMAGTQTTGTINLANNSYSSDATAVFARMTGGLTPTLKNAMATFIDSQVSSGNWAKIEEFHFFGMDTQVNALTGWKGICNGSLNNGAVWNNGSNIQTDGVDDYYNTGFTPSTATLIGQNDIYMGIYIKEWNHVAGVTKGLMGAQDGTRYTYLAQSSANQLNRAVNSANSPAAYATETVFANNAHYALARTVNTTALLYKNGSQIDSDAQTSNGLPTRSVYIGARNNSGSADLFASCKVCSWVVAKGNIDAANFYSNLSTLITNVGA